MPDPIKAVCHRDYYPAARASGVRPVSAIKWIVMHSTEGGTADSIARYFRGSNAQGSTHLVVDDQKCQRCLPDIAICWGATGANFAGFHIEQCGFARWSKDNWLQHWRTLRRAAYKTAVHCKKFGIPPRFVWAADLKAGKAGVTTHNEVSHAFAGSGHWDPGPQWPRKLFMGYVRAYLLAMKVPL